MLGGFPGVGRGMLLLAWGEFSIGAEGVTIAFQPSANLAIVGMVICVFVGIAAGIVSGWQEHTCRLPLGQFLPCSACTSADPLARELASGTESASMVRRRSSLLRLPQS